MNTDGQSSIFVSDNPCQSHQIDNFRQLFISVWNELVYFNDFFYIFLILVFLRYECKISFVNLYGYQSLLPTTGRAPWRWWGSMWKPLLILLTSESLNGSSFTRPRDPSLHMFKVTVHWPFRLFSYFSLIFYFYYFAPNL